MESGCVAPPFFIKVNGQLHALAALPPRKSWMFLEKTLDSAKVSSPAIHPIAHCYIDYTIPVILLCTPFHILLWCKIRD